jgi:Concanavalin A-like lectin/glucanases superfamily
MKFLKAFFSVSLLYVLLLGGGSQFSACTKEIIHDTLIVRDTVTIIDSTCHLNDGLIAYYNFNNGSLKDSSGNNNHIIFNNATKTTDRLGRANNAYLFDGSTSYMQVKNSQTLNPANITMMATVKFNGFNQGQYHANQLFMKGFRDQELGIYGLRAFASTGDCCSVPGDTSKVIMEGYYGDYGSTLYAADTTYFVRTNKWVTEVVTYDGVQSKIYVDGVLKNTVTGSPFFTINTNDLFIGKTENPAFPYWFKGVIDEIRIYNKALCADDVKQLSSLKQ